MRGIGTFALSVVASIAFVSSGLAADVQLSIRDGRVTLIATDATAGEILAQWATVGQTRIVNLEVVPRERMTIELKNVSEEQALAVLLRGVSGYIAAPRASAQPDASRFDRIVVMPPSVTRMAARPPGPPAAGPGDASLQTAAAEEIGERTVGEQGAAASADPAASDGAAGDQAAADPNDPAQLARKALSRLAAVEGAESSTPPAVTYQAVAAAQAPAQALDGFEPPTAQNPVRPAPPSRPMASGRMSERASSSMVPGSPRDKPFIGKPASAQQPADAASDMGEEVPPAVSPGAIPTQDAATQASIKARRAIETVDPREFHFQIPPPAAARPAGPTPAGAAKPGATTSGTPGQPAAPRDPGLS